MPRKGLPRRPATRPTRSGPPSRQHNDATEVESVNKLKKKIRNAERLLQNRADLPADVEVAKQRELASLRHDLNAITLKKRRAKMIHRYHRLRFFERQKADRRLKQVKKGSQEGKDVPDESSVQKALHVAQVDLNYTLYHPLLVPYSSLFRSSTDNDVEKVQHDNADAILATRQTNEMWLRVEKATELGAHALNILRNEDPAGGMAVAASSAGEAYGNKGSSHTRTGSATRRKSSIQDHKTSQQDKSVEDESFSDDDFFE